MSLPPGFLDELRTRTSLSQVVGRKVMWDNRKSNQAKGDMWAPCPFHQEKSASFHVDDRKGFYYCFGCHAKGDAISFVRETENVGFMEAIEILAGEAGMQMPAKDPRAKEKADRRTQLVEVMETAVRYFRLQLKTGAGTAARDYLFGKRGLSEAAVETFEIGVAPDGWQGLWDHLTGQGIAPEMILACGLARESTKGGKPYDVFRNRIMFPIRDGRGRAIAFGGRAMDPNDKAKYLNSPETELFDKGHNLYNLGPAREAAGKGQPLVVAEGYMDVIALSEAGFGAAVAPLGTAVTEPQLQTLWRVAAEPLIALDGDAAGLRAAYRVIDLALPLLESGRSLRFAIMPEGKDPDDLVRAGGPQAVQGVLDAAAPMVDLLWRRETEGRVFDSPERKAALDRSLRDALKLIPDPSLRYHYGDEIKRLRWDLFRPPTRSAGGTPRRLWRAGGPAAPAAPTAAAKASLLVSDARAEEHIREAVILAAALTTPAVLGSFDAEIAGMDCTDPTHTALRDALVGAMPATQEEATRAATEAIGREALESFLGAPHLRVVPCLRRPGDEEVAALTVAEELAKRNAARGRRDAEDEAVEDLEAHSDEVVTWRLRQASETYARAQRAAGEDDMDYETGANGARIDRGERDAFAALMETIRFEKGRR
ncbi:DNA primase [Roseivivax jejudonensis]|uniref:DNA primase n=1 Tax=Roseivivax jejudonensis TaxID=1529041 RepID=A0A1X7A9C2_9RHOB|nr:DNA primase [Roseivivax jejudonensis]SLN73734.1 DNA primase [Roseivivax jejudonensis]